MLRFLRYSLAQGTPHCRSSSLSEAPLGILRQSNLDGDKSRLLKPSQAELNIVQPLFTNLLLNLWDVFEILRNGHISSQHSLEVAVTICSVHSSIPNPTRTKRLVLWTDGGRLPLHQPSSLGARQQIPKGVSVNPEFHEDFCWRWFMCGYHIYYKMILARRSSNMFLQKRNTFSTR